MSEPDPIAGFKTFEDGHHEPLRRSEAEALIAAADGAQARRARDMPTERDAIEALFRAYQRLKEGNYIVDSLFHR